ncbi:hypothetical protein ABGB16_28660 [Micromonospora sp. B11E3]|uniref:hypothetical protein n=1 Tax=Micromonospora sp. B11E3 TaxID=3153562 RepID=UPI00325CBED6
MWTTRPEALLSSQHLRPEPVGRLFSATVRSARLCAFRVIDSTLPIIVIGITGCSNGGDAIASIPLNSLEVAMDKKIETKRKPAKVVVRKLEKLETTVAILDPGCRNDLCS